MKIKNNSIRLNRAEIKAAILDYIINNGASWDSKIVKLEMEIKRKHYYSCQTFVDKIRVSGAIARLKNNN